MSEGVDAFARSGRLNGNMSEYTIYKTDGYMIGEEK